VDAAVSSIVAAARRGLRIVAAMRDGLEERRALQLDEGDPLPAARSEFAVPPWPGGRHPEWAYFAGNSLGLMPRAARDAVAAELDEWARLGVEAWFEAREPWLEYAGTMRPSVGALVGGLPHEVAVMSSLTVNLHLLLATFYRPSGERCRIMIEEASFPSDAHAVQSRAGLHGLEPAETVVTLQSRPGESTLRTEDVVAAIETEGPRLALVLLGAVSYLTGEVLDVAEITRAARAVGAVCGWDLAHAIGNVPLELHEAGADFAVWCHYKYVNAGPGAPGGLFVHERHAGDAALPRLAGWWGVDPATRFRMERTFVPRPGAEGWAVSTPPILALAPLGTALELFDRHGLGALRARSARITGYLEQLLDDVASTRTLSVTTPRDPGRRGCQLSVAVPGARELASRLRREHGVVCDFREPDVLRLAPVPLYNTFHDCWRAAEALRDVLQPR
jgi:kynureninase